MDQYREATAPVTRVEQSTDYYCGAASSVMVFSYFKDTVLQSDAYGSIREHMKEPNDWYSDPAGISGCLNALPSPKSIPFRVDPFASGTLSDIVNKIFYTLYYLKAPCVSLVYGGLHWVVVDGIRYTEGTSASRTFLGVYITDPYNGEPMRRYIPIDPFQSAYMLPDTFGTLWRQKMVVISDDTTNLGNLTSGSSAAVFGGGGVRSPESIAIDGLLLQGFKGLTPVLGGGGPKIGPVEVTSMSDGTKFTLTFLDARVNSEFGNFICVAVDVARGSVLEVASDVSAIHVLDDNAAQRLLWDRFHGRAVVVLPGQFWQLTPKTRSRFSLIRKLRIDGVQHYLFPDGEVMEYLPTFMKGG